jgi:hypothetical protein
MFLIAISTFGRPHASALRAQVLYPPEEGWTDSLLPRFKARAVVVQHTGEERMVTSHTPRSTAKNSPLIMDASKFILKAMEIGPPGLSRNSVAIL